MVSSKPASRGKASASSKASSSSIAGKGPAASMPAGALNSASSAPKRGQKARASNSANGADAPNKKRLFSELDANTSFLKHEPKVPRTSLDEKLYSDYFSASKSKYKSRIARFVREAQGRGEVASTAIATNRAGADANVDNDRMDLLQKKSRFSFKGDGIVAVSQIIDVFCQGLMHEAKRGARVRENVHDPNKLVSLTKEDLQGALGVLGWDHVNSST